MKYGIFSLAAGLLFFGAMPASSSYGIHNYSFGSGGTGGSTSSSYKLNATTGETSNVVFKLNSAHKVTKPCP